MRRTLWDCLAEVRFDDETGELMVDQPTPEKAESRAAISSVGVVVPAHNEGALIGQCLRALATAASRSPVPVRVVVVCDDCMDDTAYVARDAGAEVLTVSARNVGVARAAGMAALLHGQARARWLATTDADTIVSPDWIQRQVDLADAGADAVVGVVGLLHHDARPGLDVGMYEALYARGLSAEDPPSHTHVHGACLGVRASAYEAVGGFQPLALHEDRELVAALEAADDIHVVRTSDVVVQTSARADFRAIGGFGTYLGNLPSRAAADVS